MRRFVLPLFLATLLVGCAGYQLGPAKPTFMEGIETIAVATARNKTLEPRIGVLVADSVIKQIQQDGTYRVAREADADAILELTIEELERNSVRSVRGNVLATREFEYTMKLQYRIYRRGTGVNLRTGAALGQTNFFVSDDLNQDERQAIPLAAQRAAVSLVSEISEGW